jgi:hypothetical protein
MIPSRHQISEVSTQSVCFLHSGFLVLLGLLLQFCPQTFRTAPRSFLPNSLATTANLPNFPRRLNFLLVPQRIFPATTDPRPLLKFSVLFQNFKMASASKFFLDSARNSCRKFSISLPNANQSRCGRHCEISRSSLKHWPRSSKFLIALVIEMNLKLFWNHSHLFKSLTIPKSDFPKSNIPKWRLAQQGANRLQTGINY